jgi:hypothetical protein
LAILMELIRPLLRERRQGLTRRLGTTDGLIVDVRNIANVLHPEACDLQGAPEDVLDGKRPEVADMGRAINRWAAAIHPEGRTGGLHQERPQLAAHGVMQKNGHSRAKK